MQKYLDGDEINPQEIRQVIQKEQPPGNHSVLGGSALLAKRIGLF